MNMIKWIFAACLSASCGLAHGTVTPWIDFQIVDGFVVIPTEIKGIKGHSVIDTGAQFTAIANSFVEKNELALTRSKPVTIRGVNGTQTRASYQNVPATLMGAETVFSTVIDLDLGDRPQLLIGGDFLRTLYFQFDYPNKRLRAISRDAFDLKKLSNVKSKVDKASRQPIAQVRLNDQQNVWLTIDTGNTLGVVMKRGVAAKRGWMDEYPTETLSLRGAIESAEMENSDYRYYRLVPTT